MAAAITIEVSGLTEAIDSLDPAKLDGALRAAAAEIAPRALAIWRNATPFRTGRLRSSLAVVPTPDGLRFFVRPPGFYYAPANAHLGGRITKSTHAIPRK